MRTKQSRTFFTLKNGLAIFLFSILVSSLGPTVLIAQPKPEDIVFEIKEGPRYFLNGKDLSYPFVPAEFVRELGDTNRDDWQWRAYGLTISSRKPWGKHPKKSDYYEYLDFNGAYFDDASIDPVDFHFKGKFILCGLEVHQRKRSIAVLEKELRSTCPKDYTFEVGTHPTMRYPNGVVAQGFLFVDIRDSKGNMFADLTEKGIGTSFMITGREKWTSKTGTGKK